MLPAHAFAQPTQVTSAFDGTDRLFVVERAGAVRSIRNGVLEPAIFLDLRAAVGDNGLERGLLSIAFHPGFESNRLLYVLYTDVNGDVTVARLTANDAGTRVDPATHRRLIVIEHSAAGNHNGGSLVFGPNGYLYISVGDGGGRGDPENDSRSNHNLLGKVLRIDVNGTGAGPWHRYANPRSNPYYGSRPGLSEIWAKGLRNPWRMSFDRGTGRLFIADVGQGQMEEIDREPAGFRGGADYGWNVIEGPWCFERTSCPLAGDTLPVAFYRHLDGNCSVTGGFVYRGPTETEMVGQYIFADFCSGRIWSLPSAGGQGELVLRADTAERITSFGESDGGVLYAVSQDGKLFRVLSG